MAESKNVMIFAEIQDGKVASIVAEVMTAAKGITAKSGGSISAALIGSGVKGLAQEIIDLGAAKVYVVDNGSLAKYNSEGFVAAMDAACKQSGCDVLLFGQTQVARDLAPRLAFRVGTGYVPDCVEFDFDGGYVKMTRPVYGGNALATYTVDGKPQLASVRAKTHEPASKAAASGEVVDVAVSIDAAGFKAQVKDVVISASEGMRLEDAPVIVAGGRGIGSHDKFKQLEELAKLLGGTVAGSRPACDAGWVAAETQVGQTGKIIGPNVYIAVAISGAMQHMAGCLASKTIVAVNKDAEAPIFKLAHYGIVGDWQSVIPAFTAKIKSL